MTRILTASVLIAITLPILIFSHTVAFPIFLAVAGMMCVWEICRCKGLHKKLYLLIPAAAYVGISPFAVFYNPAPQSFAHFLLILTALFLVYIYFSGVFYYGKVNTDDLSYVAFFAVYIALGMVSVVFLRSHVSNLFMLVFFTPWISDAMAMYTGKLFGKKKLCPNISPKKTVAGAIGSTVGTVITVLIYVLVVNTWFDGSYNYLMLALVSLPAAAVIQLGDLSASVVKRHYGVKDYGNLLPGHGGVMDRCDSILPTAVYGSVILYAAVFFFNYTV